MNSEIYRKYFPGLTEEQIHLLEEFKTLFLNWNNSINLISRKDTDDFEINHVLHSISIARVFDFKKGTEIMDFGTGGGFPGIPLAIYFPEVKFTLVDSIGKKIKAVRSICSDLKLRNVDVVEGRVEELTRKFDFITCRAVGRIGKILPWVQRSLKQQQQNEKPNGFIFLKGGDLAEELSEANMPYQRIKISEYFSEDFFQTKEIVYLSKYI